MLFGYELEFFCINKRDEIVVPKSELRQYCDDGGILLEARGEAFNHPRLAETSLKLAIEKLRKAVRQVKRRLLLADEGTVSPRSLIYAKSNKNWEESEPVFERFRNPVRLEHHFPGQHKAGLHVHFSQPDPNNAQRFSPFDMLYPIRLLDQEFESVIRAANRHPGAYQIKSYGMEYRSLPASVPLRTVTKTLLKMLQPREFEAYSDNTIPDDEDEL